MTRLLPLILSLWLFTGCQSPNLDHARAPADQAAAGTSDLSWAEAKARGSRVTRPRYILNVKLNETEKTFSGASEIRFNLNDPSKPLRVDFFEGQVAKMQLNGKPLAPEAKKPYWIELPPERLVNGENSLTVEYTQEYSTQGQGLHRAVDPETKQVFLYSQFETFDANRFMPCFDQPDMRAALTMTVEAPEKWEVVTATRETKITRDARAKTRTWSFPQTPEISTYLFSLHAGPYKVWTDKFEDIPLRLFARPSQAKYLRAKEFFTYTKKGLKFFNAYFDFKYPFKKYDQLVVPEFNAGAMENVAAVTFSERFLWRSEPTRQQLQGLSSVILHEMAHMWFGDIVTMKWWNDLWLNESFATYMAALANTESNDFPEEWQDFFASDKAWAYWEDALVTTHPIEAPVNTVKEAFATFDGITYGKGAAVLKQLNAYVTPQAFRAGIRKYIQRYAYKNADLNDFIAALQGETKRDLSLWAERWLRQSGTDKIAARWSCAGDRLTAVELIVTPTPGAKFRPQTVNVGLFEEKNGGLAKPVSVRADLLEPVTKLQGSWSCPVFVFPNLGDHGFVSVSLDAKSLEYAKKNLAGMPDQFLRTMLWDGLWKMVRDTEMPLKNYIDIVDTHFAKESDPIATRQITSTLGGSWGDTNTVLNYWPQTDERLRAERLAFWEKMETEYLRRFQGAKAGSDEQREWFDRYVALARSQKALDQIASWAQMKTVAKGMPLDLDRKWNVTERLARFQHTQAPALFAEAKKIDKSDRGQRRALAVEAVQPDPKIKEKWVQTLTQPKPAVSWVQARAVLRALFPVEQAPLAKRFEKDFYSYLKTHGRSENEIFVEGVAENLSPLNCAAENSASMRAFLKDTSGFNASIAKALKVELDEDERCQRVRAMSSI